MQPASRSRCVRFGVFEFDPATGDLWKSGHRSRLQEQPRQVLGRLVARPGDLITREELRAVLWPGDTFVDYETGLNVVVNKLRQALGDSAAAPRFIETIPRRGYRFVAPVAPAGMAVPAGAVNPRPAPRKPPSRIAGLLAAVAFGAAVAVWSLSFRDDTGTSASPRIETLAVLPLENLSGGPDEVYFADGITEALTTELASLRALNVISRQSTMRYRGSTQPSSAIARELGNVHAIVRGSVSRAGDQARLTVQLVDAATDRLLWAHAYEHDLRDILELQREVARAVAAEIRITLTPGERAKLDRARPIDPAAYDAYLRGRYLLAGVSETSQATDRALAEFERAASLDPDYAPAWVGIAEVYQVKGTNQGGRPPIETRPRAYRAAKRAVDLDPELGEAYAMLARVQMSEFDWPGADRSFARMLELSPGNASGLVWYAYSLLVHGRFDEAVDVARRAEALDPLDLNTRVRVGFVHYFARQYDEAVKRYEDVLALDDDNLMARDFLSTAYEALGRADDAVSVATVTVERHGRLSVALGRLASGHGRAGHRAEAQALIDELLAMSRRQYVPPAHIAIAYGGIGNRDRALEFFDKAYEERSNFMVYFPITPMYDEWRDHPRYVRLVEKIRRPHTVREDSQ